MSIEFSVRHVTTAVALIMILAGGCSRTDPGHPKSVDKHILRDVVTATYPIPGPEVRRGMRVLAFMRGLAIKQCGGTPEPVNGTTERYAQDLFPDLGLVRSRGFAEDTVDPATTIDPACVLVPKKISSYRAWMDQGARWQNMAQHKANNSTALAPLKPLMAECLRKRTGLTVSARDPATFLYSVNTADQEGATRGQYMAWSAAYADCGREYFATLASELAKPRATVVAQNDELLRSLAAELNAAGYRP